MIKIKSGVGIAKLEVGQVWRMAQADLRVEMVGKLLVHYKLGKSSASRIAKSCSAITTVEKFLSKNKALLMEQTTPIAVV